jgi:hypothetical protein
MITSLQAGIFDTAVNIKLLLGGLILRFLNFDVGCRRMDYNKLSTVPEGLFANHSSLEELFVLWIVKSQTKLVS